MAKLSLAALIVSAAYPMFSQVVPSATQRSWPLEIGGGLSYFDNHIINFSFPTYEYTAIKGNLLGPAAWADWTLNRIPHRLYGLGIEAEGRHLAWDNSGTDPLLKEDTGAGGVIYMWRHSHNFHPYGKFLMGFGSIDFQGNYTGCTHNCKHDTDTFWDPGGGVEVHIMGNLWARGDYEEEFWTHFGNVTNKTIYPRGFTIGVSYDMRNFHFGREKEY
jgi:opacity protein-like surface antigen